MTVFGFCFIKSFQPPLQPAVGHLHGEFGVVVVRSTRGTFIKGHDNIRPYGPLYVYYIFRSEQMFTSINVGAKGGTLFFQFATSRERKHLETTTIGQDGTLPAIELVQTSGTFQSIHPWS